MIKVQGSIATDQMKEQNKMQQFILKMAQDDKSFSSDLAKDLTELELKYGVDIKGGDLVNASGQGGQSSPPTNSLDDALKAAQIRKMNAEAAAQELEIDLIESGVQQLIDDGDV